jgi:hypothetical protein
LFSRFDQRDQAGLMDGDIADLRFVLVLKLQKKKDNHLSD